MIPYFWEKVNLASCTNFQAKIVEIASKRKIRRVATANAPPRAFVQNDEKNPAGLHQRDSIGFANGNCYHVGLFLTKKSVVPDETPNSHILPSCPVCVLISQSIILGKRTPPIIDKTGIFRHGKLTGFLVIPCMFCGSALQVVCCSYFQDITAFCVHIMPHIQKFFLTADSITSFLGGGIDGPAYPGYFFGLRFCTSVNSKLSSPIEKAICRSLLVTCRFAIENWLFFSRNSASSAIMPPLVALGFLCRGVNLQVVGAFLVPAWANFCATFALSGGRSYCVRSPASTALSQASKSFSSCGDRFNPLYLAIRSASVILLLIISPLFL